MPIPDEIRRLTEGVIASFDSGIGAIGNLIGTGLELLDGYRREEEAVRGNLRETLASIGSLRRKDFDGVMERILNFQSRREVEIRTFIKGFLGRQRELAGRLKRSLEAGVLSEVEKAKGELSRMIEEAREEIVSFQKEQQLIRTTLDSLEAKKGEISARDFKKAIGSLEAELFGAEGEQQAIGNS